MLSVRTRLFLGAFPLLAALALTSGCDCGGPVGPHGTPCSSNTQCHGGMLCIDGTCRTPSDSGPVPDGSTGIDAHVVAPVPVSLAVVPASATLTSTDGSRPTQAFTAQLTYDDGSTGAATAVDWSLDARTIGDIDPAGGTFTANGVVGGTAMVSAVATIPGHGTLAATAMVEVVIVRTVTGAGVPTDVATTFATATAVSDPAREAGLVYPLDQAVMPQNVYPADFQWTRGAPGDLVRITLTKPSIQVTTYLVDDANHHWLADADAWRSLAQTNPDVAAVIRADRIDPATHELVRGTDVHLTFARAALTGSVYYWAIAQGRIIRIDDGTATRNSFMPSPEQGCVGCHSVSPSGRYMIGRFGGGDNVGSVFDLTTDLTSAPPVSLWPGRTTTWWFSSWSPDETRAVVTYQEGVGGQFRFMNPQTGAYIDPPGMPRGTHPAWSHDGTRIAYSANVNGWGGGYSAGDIGILPVTGPDMVGAPIVIQTGASLATSSPAGNASCYPTWAPGDTAIAFAHGSGPRSESDQSALYIMAPDGSGVVRLDAANGGGTLNYQPRFSPFTQGGYFWLSFLSRRDYGNAQVGTLGHSRQQIWVTAISTTGTSGAADPSRVPYWLPGQDTASQNISAYWAPRACRADGDTCTVGSECCGGECTPGPGGALVCSPPPPERCHRVSETCSTDADCCASDHLSCVDHVCIHPLM
jgi:hypothetical protein